MHCLVHGFIRKSLKELGIVSYKALLIAIKLDLTDFVPIASEVVRLWLDEESPVHKEYEIYHLNLVNKLCNSMWDEVSNPSAVGLGEKFHIPRPVLYFAVSRHFGLSMCRWCLEEKV